jgi:GxxExxY protein
MDFVEWREQRGEKVDSEAERLATLVIGAGIEVHEQLGPGHSERVYEEALCHELTLRGIPFERQVRFKVLYKTKEVGEGWVDLLVGGRLVVELKSVEQLSNVHREQALAYLVAMNLRLALLMNFNVTYLKDGIKRVVRDPKPSS